MKDYKSIIDVAEVERKFEWRKWIDKIPFI